MRLSEAIHEFMLVDRPETTQTTYQKTLDLLSGFLGEDREIASISPSELRAWIQHMRALRLRYACHPSRPPVPGALSTATIRQRVKTARVFFNWLVAEGFLEVSPMQRVKTPCYRRGPDDCRSITPDDASAMFNIADHSRDRAMLLFLTTGCRAGGLCSARMATLRFDDEGGNVVVTEKGGVSRRVHFGPEVRDALKAWLAERLETDHDYVFISLKDGRPLLPGGVYQMCRRLARKAGVKGRFNPHAFRHLVGQVLADANEPVMVTQLVLGHTDPQTTYETYYGVRLERVMQVARGLARTILSSAL